jgi:hypothetical protein
MTNQIRQEKHRPRPSYYYRALQKWNKYMLVAECDYIIEKVRGNTYMQIN